MPGTDLQLQTFPFLPQEIHQTTHLSAQFFVGIFQDLRHLPAQAGRPFAKAYAALQQKGAFD